MQGKKNSAVEMSATRAIVRAHESWRMQRWRWVQGLPRHLKSALAIMTLWTCLGISSGALTLAAEPHGLTLPCGIALVVGSVWAWSMLVGATWVEDELAQRATWPLFFLLTVVAVLMPVVLAGPRVELAVLAALELACLIVAWRPASKLRHDFGWRGLKRVGASGSAEYADWLLALRSCLQARAPDIRPSLPFVEFGSGKRGGGGMDG